MDGHVPEDGPPSTRVRRSQNLVNGLSFDFMVHCLFCNETCAPVNKRHPQRCDRVRQCPTCERPGLPTFRDTIVEIAKQRNDELGRRVLLNIGEETDLPALDSQYHVRCYNLFRPVNQNVDVSPDNVVDDAALKSCINVMYADQNRPYSHTELYDIDAGYGGELSQKQMRVKLTDYLADDIIVIRCDGCASLIGFKGFVSSMIKLVKVNGDDEESEIDAIIRMIRKEAREVSKSSNLFYGLSNFTHRNTVGQTSAAILLSFVSALVSNSQI